VAKKDEGQEEKGDLLKRFWGAKGKQERATKGDCNNAASTRKKRKLLAVSVP